MPSRTSPLGTAGVNRITLVSDTTKGLTGTCARTEVAQNISKKLARNGLFLINITATTAAGSVRVVCLNARTSSRSRPGSGTSRSANAQPSASSVTNEYPADPCYGSAGGVRQHLEHSGALIDLVEHRTVDHRRARAQGVVYLAPVEAAAVTRNLVADWSPGAQRTISVGERIAGKHHRQVVNAHRARGFKIGRPDAGAIPVGRCFVVETSDRPGTQHAELGPDLLPFGIGGRIEAPCPPIRRHAAHDCHLLDASRWLCRAI